MIKNLIIVLLCITTFISIQNWLMWQDAYLSRRNEFCDGFYFGVMGSQYKSFEYRTVKRCAKEYPSLERMIKDIYNRKD